MTPKQKTITVHLKDIKQVFDVRKRLNDDWVIQLALLYEKGTELPPIEVTKDYTILDGRHRVAASDMAGRETIKAIVVDNMSDADRLQRAFAANIGGAWPPTREDIFHTVHRFLDLGLSQKQIIDRLPYERSISRKYVESASGSRAQANLNKALQSMTDENLTVAQAAEKFLVSPEKIKAALTGKRKHVRDAATLKGASTSAYNGMSKRNGALLRRLLKEYEDGFLPAKTAINIADHLEHLVKLQLKAINDWKQRFLAIVNPSLKLEPSNKTKSWTPERRAKAAETMRKINEKKYGSSAVQ